MPDPNKTPPLLTQPSNSVQVQLNQPPKPGKFTPTLEEGLAIPLLLAGAFLSGRNTPLGSSIGNTLGLGGQLLEQHGQFRYGKAQSASNVHGKIKQYDALDKQQTPGAYNLWQKIKPSVVDLDPDDALSQFGNLDKMIESELNKTAATTQYYNRNTGGYERHNISEFQGGKVPGYLIPTGGTGDITSQLYKQKWNLPGKESDAEQVRDTVARAMTGTDFATVNKNNPRLAAAVIAEATRLTAQPRADIQESKDLAMLQAHENAEMSERVALLNMTPRGPVEEYLNDREGISPGTLRSMPKEQQRKLYDKVNAALAVEAADRAGASTTARAAAGGNAAKTLYLNQPLGKSHFFSVNPKTLAREGGPDLTMKEAHEKGLAVVSDRNEQYYDEGLAALHDLDSIKAYGAPALAGLATYQKGSLLPTAVGRTLADLNMAPRGVDAYLAIQDNRGDVSAHNFRTARINLIAVLRAMAKTGRPNASEAQLALSQMEHVGNVQQLYGAVNVAKRAITGELHSHISSGTRDSGSELNNKISEGATSGMRGGGEAAPSPDPGYSVELPP